MYTRMSRLISACLTTILTPVGFELVIAHFRLIKIKILIIWRLSDLHSDHAIGVFEKTKFSMVISDVEVLLHAHPEFRQVSLNLHIVAFWFYTSFTRLLHVL